MITLRYPATVEVTPLLRDRLRRQRPDGPTAGQLSVRRLVIHGRNPRPMFVGKTIAIPEGGEVRFR
jgi:hypothetical protein